VPRSLGPSCSPIPSSAVGSPSPASTPRVPAAQRIQPTPQRITAWSVVRNVAELADDLGIPKYPVAGSPERPKATAPTMRKRFGLLHGRVRIEAFGRLAGDGAVGDEGHGDSRSPRSSRSSLRLLLCSPARPRSTATVLSSRTLRAFECGCPPRSDGGVRPTLPAGTSEACRPLRLAAPSRSAAAAPRRYCQSFRSCSTIPRRNGLRVGAKHRGGAAAADVGPRA
jgi:hypothetical protein